MNVAFRRTGARRYAVIVSLAGEPSRKLEPAPGYDDDIPHDLVHYLVEAELGLTYAVYGSAARGGGTFFATFDQNVGARAHTREQRKRKKRELALRAHDDRHSAEMERSEKLALVCDVSWRRRHGQSADPGRPAPVVRAEDAPHVARVVAHLEAIAPLWRELPVGGELVFAWPGVRPTPRMRHQSGPPEGGTGGP